MNGTVSFGRRHPAAALTLAALLFSQAIAAQLPATPQPQKNPPATQQSSVGEDYVYRVGAICGSGVTTSTPATRPTFGCGVGLTILPLPIFFEFGVMGPQANRSYLSGYISLDASLPLARAGTLHRPFALVGYSRLFETGHALDYGVALALPRTGKPKGGGDSLRIELRDYWTFANPSQHNVFLRFGLMSEESD